MQQYLLSIIQPDGQGLSRDVLQETNRDVDALHAEMRSVGAWIFSGGLHWPSTATMLRPGADDVAAAEGPFAEGTEQVSGIVVIQAPDSIAALD